MENNGNEHRVIPRSLWIVGIGILAMFLMLADAVKSVAGTAASAAPEKTYTFHIASKPLSEALMDFGAVTGLTVLFTQQQPSKLTAPALSGTFTAAQALDLLLAGSGYTYRFVNSRTVTLDALPPGGAKNAMILPTLKVQAKNKVPDEIETGGPAVGYVATHDFAATKTDTPILEIPQSISVVTQTQMKQQDAQSVQQALRYTAGVNTRQYDQGTQFADYITIRGFYPLIYQDGLLTNYSTTTSFEPFGLDRVEVLKGPSSVLYGQNVPGGVLDLITKRPTADPLRFFQLQGGSYGRVQGQFDVSGPIDSDGKLLYRLTALARSSGTQVDFAQNDRLFIAPAFTWHPTERTTFTFLSNYQQDTNGYPGNLPARGTLLANPFGTLPTNLNSAGPYATTARQKYYGVGYLLEHRLNRIFTLRQNFRFAGYYGDLNYVYPLGFATNPITGKKEFSTVLRGTEAQDLSNVALTLDNQAQAKFSTGPFKHTFLVGVDYWRNTSDSQTGFGVAPSLNVFSPVYLPVSSPPTDAVITDEVQDQAGIYAQEQLKWNQFVLLIGGRQDWVSTDVSNKLTHTRNNQNDNKLTGRIGLVYLFDMGLAPYASWSTSFQPQTGTDFKGNGLQPSSGESYEVGVKYQPPETNSMFTASLFDITQDNVLTPDLAHPGFSAATGQVRSRGVELQETLSLTRGLDLISSYTYLDLTNTKSNDPTEGNTPWGQPKHAGSLWAYYTFQKGVLEGLGFGGGVRYIGSTWSYSNSLEAPNVALVDAAMSYRYKGATLSVNIDNLFDKQYLSYCYSNTTCLYGARLNVIGGASYSF